METDDEWPYAYPTSLLLRIIDQRRDRGPVVAGGTQWTHDVAFEVGNVGEQDVSKTIRDQVDRGHALGQQPGRRAGQKVRCRLAR